MADAFHSNEEDISPSKPLEGTKVGCIAEVLMRRNPLALAHFTNHPLKGMAPNIMVCLYDFPLAEKSMITYIQNIIFSNEKVTMRRFGSFWFKLRAKDGVFNYRLRSK